ncbi:MAG: hypothetical protein ACI91J_004234, partial [Yoonia sp.]
ARCLTVIGDLATSGESDKSQRSQGNEDKALPPEAATRRFRCGRGHYGAGGPADFGKTIFQSKFKFSPA